MSEFIFEQCSSLEKIFLTSSSINGGYTNANALKGEEFSYQIAFRLASGEKNRTDNRYKFTDKGYYNTLFGRKCSLCPAGLSGQSR